MNHLNLTIEDIRHLCEIHKPNQCIFSVATMKMALEKIDVLVVMIMAIREEMGVFELTGLDDI